MSDRLVVRALPGESLGEYLNRQRDECGRTFHQVGSYRRPHYLWADPYNATGDNDLRIYIEGDTFRVKLG